MTVLDRYVAGKLLQSLLPTVVGITALIFVGGTFRLLQEEDLSLPQILAALPWLLPNLLPFIIPLAWLVTVTLVFGRLVADREVVAFSCLGISWRALAWPAAVVGIGLSLLCLVLGTTLAPYAHQRRKEAAAAVFLQLAHLNEGQHLSRTFNSQGLDIYVRDYGPGRLEGIVLHKSFLQGGQTPEDRRDVHLVAERGTVRADPEAGQLVLALEDVSLTLRSAADPPTAMPVRVHLTRYVQRASIGGWWRTKVKDYATPDLRRMVEVQEELQAVAGATGGLVTSFQTQNTARLEAEVEIALRAALSLAPLLLALLAAPLTVLLQSQSPLVPFFYGVVAGSLLYFTPTLAGSSLAEATGSAAWVFLGCATSLGGAGVLGWWASRTY